MKSGERLILALAGSAGILDTSFLIPVMALYATSLGASAGLAGFIPLVCIVWLLSQPVF